LTAEPDHDHQYVIDLGEYGGPVDISGIADPNTTMIYFRCGGDFGLPSIDKDCPNKQLRKKVTVTFLGDLSIINPTTAYWSDNTTYGDGDIECDPELVTYGKKPSFDVPEGFVSMGQMMYSRLLDGPRTFQYSSDLGRKPMRNASLHWLCLISKLTAY
jgi:hypothetical protein